MEILAIIPARGGSKGLPGKNIRPLLDHPLISYSILAAKKSPSITRIIVSTDDEEIASIAKAYGAEVPVLRPSQYAADLSTDFEVINHMIEWLKHNDNYQPDLVAFLRPTSPIRSIHHIEKSINKIIFSDCDSLRIVTDAPLTPYKMWTINNFDSNMIPLINDFNIDEPFNQPRQKLPKKYWQIGYLDLIKLKTIIKKNSVSGNRILPFYVDIDYAIDIDTLEDFQMAEKSINKIECVKHD